MTSWYKLLAHAHVQTAQTALARRVTKWPSVSRTGHGPPWGPGVAQTRRVPQRGSAGGCAGLCRGLSGGILEQLQHLLHCPAAAGQPPAGLPRRHPPALRGPAPAKPAWSLRYLEPRRWGEAGHACLLLGRTCCGTKAAVLPSRQRSKSVSRTGRAPPPAAKLSCERSFLLFKDFETFFPRKIDFFPPKTISKLSPSYFQNYFPFLPCGKTH